MTATAKQDTQQTATVPLLPRRHIILISALLVLSLVPVWSVEYFPSQNGPWYLLTVKMFRDFDDPALNYSEYYQLSWHVIPYLLHNGMCYVFSLFVPLLTAQKLAITVYAVLLPLSVFYFLSVVNRRGMLFGYFSFLMVYNYPLLRGYHNFVLAVPLFFFAFAYWIKYHDGLTILRGLVLNLLILVVYLAHLFVFLALIAAIVLYTLSETRSVKTVLYRLLACCVPSGVLLVDYIHYTIRSATWLAGEELTYHPLHWTLQEFFRETFYTLSFPAFIITLIPLSIIGCVGLGKVIKWLRAWWRDRSIPVQNTSLLIVTGALLLGVFVVPYKFLGWHHVNVRFAPLAIMLAIGCVGGFPKVWLRRTFLATTVGSAVLVYALMTTNMRQVERTMINEYVSGVDKIEQDKLMLAVMFENPKIGLIRPLTRVHEYYPIAKGGANGQGVAKFNTIVPVVYRQYPIHERFPRFDADDLDRTIKRVAQTYHYVLFWGKHDDVIRRFQDQGFELLHARGRLQIYQNRWLIARERAGEACLHGATLGARPKNTQLSAGLLGGTCQ